MQTQFDLLKNVLYWVLWRFRASTLSKQELSGKGLSRLDLMLLSIHSARALKEESISQNDAAAKRWAGSSGDAFWNNPDHLMTEEQIEVDEIYRRPFLDTLLVLMDREGSTRVIELGSGGGGNLAYLKERRRETNFLGLDVNQAIVERSKATYPNIDFLVADILRKNLDELDLNSRTLVFCSCVLMYFNQANILRVLNQLPTGALFAINEPFTEKITKNGGPLTHSLFSYYHDYVKIFLDAGFILLDENYRKTHNDVLICSLIFKKS